MLKCWGLGGCQDERLLKVWCKKPLPPPEVLEEVEAVAMEYESGAEEEWKAAGKVAALMSGVSES